MESNETEDKNGNDTGNVDLTGNAKLIKNSSKRRDISLKQHVTLFPLFMLLTVAPELDAAKISVLSSMIVLTLLGNGFVLVSILYRTR